MKIHFPGQVKTGRNNILLVVFDKILHRLFIKYLLIQFMAFPEICVLSIRKSDGNDDIFAFCGKAQIMQKNRKY